LELAQEHLQAKSAEEVVTRLGDYGPSFLENKNNDKFEPA